jgi:TonB family protein
MFGFGRRKCSQCGEALESMGQSGDRTDDLMKNSAIGGKQMASGLCARCRAIAGSGAGRSASLPTPPPPVSVPRTVAQVAESRAPETKADYEPGGDFKTENEKQALFGAPSFDAIKNLPDLIVWLIGTTIGRYSAMAAFAFIAVIFNSFDDNDDLQPVDMPAPYEAPQPAPPSVEAPIATAPARPANNPGSWVTTNDYPLRALAQERQGATSFRVSVNAQGAVTACEITQSSGHADLDAATCSAVQKRARFDPAPDGTDDRSYRNRVQWRIPE